MGTRWIIALVIIAALEPSLGSSHALTPQLTRPPFVVNVTADDEDQRPGDGRCRTSAGGCTLRAAIQEANALEGVDTIHFAIPGSGAHLIVLAETLPTLSDTSGGTTIDGYSQPGAHANRDPLVSNARLMIELVGPRSLEQTQTFTALHVSSAENAIRGLALRGFRRSIWLDGPDAASNTIAGCIVGAGVDGQPWYDAIDFVEHRGGDPGAFGILLSSGAHHNTIGGREPSARNVISGNPNDGIVMRGDGTRWNRVLGNLIGLTPDGTARLRNWGDGIDINNGALSNVIGGLRPTERNVISGNHGEGIEISHHPETTRNRVIGNLIGTDPSGRAASPRIANTGFGISLEGDVTGNMLGPANVIANNLKGGIEVYGNGNRGNRIFDNRIGLGLGGEPIPNGGPGVRARYHVRDLTIGPGNEIRHNSGPAVLVADDSVTAVTITRNVLADNDGRAIELYPEGPHDPALADADDANGGIAPPVLVRGTPRAVSGVACAGCTVELYRAAGTSESAAQEFAGITVAGQDGIFIAALEGIRAGDTLTATATDSQGSTSELATALPIPTGSGEPAPLTLPGTIQAEDYRVGGPGTGYDDTSIGNRGGSYRLDDVDVRACGWRDNRACYAVAWTRDDEWLSYEVHVNRSATLSVAVLVASPRSGAVLRLEIEGRPIDATLQVPDTGSLTRWEWTEPIQVSLAEGRHVIRLLLDDSIAVDAIRAE